MRFIEINKHLINPENICYVDMWGHKTVDIYFVGRKKSIEADRDEFLALLRENSLLKYVRTRRPEIRPIEQGTNSGKSSVIPEDCTIVEGILEESDERKEPAG